MEHTKILYSFDNLAFCDCHCFHCFASINDRIWHQNLIAGDNNAHFYKSKASTGNGIIQNVHCLIPGSPENCFHALDGIHSGAIRVGCEGRLESFQKSQTDPSVKSTTWMTQGD